MIKKREKLEPVTLKTLKPFSFNLMRVIVLANAIENKLSK